MSELHRIAAGQSSSSITSDENLLRESNRITVHCLGGFRVEMGGRPVAPRAWDARNAGSRMVTALFAYLMADRGRAAGRSELMDLFWPDGDGDKAADSLNRSISGLRMFLQSHLNHGVHFATIRLEGERYQFSPSLSFWVDAEEFVQKKIKAERHLEAGDTRAALGAFQEVAELYKGDYMKGVPYSDSWCLPRRAQLRSLYHGALLQLAAVYESSGNTKEAADQLFKVLASDPANERAYERLMELHWRNGTRSEALSIYGVCARVLVKQFGLEPSSAIVQLRRRILSGDEPPPGQQEKP